MRRAALAMGDQMRLANSIMKSTKARLEGCVDRMNELQDRVRQLKRDGLLAVDSASRRSAVLKYQACLVRRPCDGPVDFLPKKNSLQQ